MTSLIYHAAYAVTDRPAPVSPRPSRRSSTRPTAPGTATSSPSKTQSNSSTRTATAWSTSEEVGQDTLSFKVALKHALRQDPDIILVGEMRDLETISIALTAAETGHLSSAIAHQLRRIHIDRIIDVFPADQQSQIRTQLAGSIQGVVCQMQ